MKPGDNSLLVGLLLVYAAASLFHFAHNAEYLSDYPNLPTWPTRSSVYLAWAGLASIGVVGFVLHRHGRQLAGPLLLGFYAACGFDGLLHYTRAPFAAHTAVMNFTIWFEVVAASALLFTVVLALVKRAHRHVLDT